MHPILTKRIEVPWLTKLHAIVSIRLGVLSLSFAIIGLSSICGVSFLLQDRVGIDLGTWCEGIAGFFGPLLCLFLVGLLIVAFVREGRGHVLVFWLGLVAGFSTFCIWLYAIANH
jgi:hypothetical protein